MQASPKQSIRPVHILSGLLRHYSAMAKAIYSKKRKISIQLTGSKCKVQSLKHLLRLEVIYGNWAAGECG